MSSAESSGLPVHQVAIAIGSNLGDRRGHIEWAVDALALHLTNLRLSSVVETDPVGVPDVQPSYLNAVLVGLTSLAPRELLARLLDIETRRGRRRTSFRAARTLDLDLVLYGDQVIADGDLVLPHPRFRERMFVLEPLAEVAPHMVDPVTGMTARELLATLRAGS